LASPSEKKNGMFAKGKSVGEDWNVQPLQSAVTQPAAPLHPSEAISSIGSEITIVGKIICKGVLKVYGLVEGELIASNALIADGARIQGDIIAQKLTIGGSVNPVGLPSSQQLLVAEKDRNGKVATKEIMPVLFSLLEGSEQPAFRAS
jgi:cytoskeletal protein CcmA (bactofilin family)